MRLQQTMGELFHNRLVTARADIPRRTDIDAPVPYRQNKHVLFGQQEGRWVSLPCADIRFLPLPLSPADRRQGIHQHLDALGVALGPAHQAVQLPPPYRMQSLVPVHRAPPVSSTGPAFAHHVSVRSAGTIPRIPRKRRCGTARPPAASPTTSKRALHYGRRPQSPPNGGRQTPLSPPSKSGSSPPARPV